MWFCSFVILLVLINHADLQKCNGVSNYFRKTDKNKNRFTTIYDGNYTVQALLTFSIGEGDECGHINKDGIVRVYAIKYAIDKINNGFFKTYGKIGLQLDDVCQSLPATMARGIEVVSLHRPNSVCRTDLLCENTLKTDFKRATALIGTSNSFSSIPLASLMSLYNIPQVSATASSRLLSKKDLYSSFFRTIPSDKMQVDAMLDVLKKFGWTYIIAIGSDDDYGKLGISDLKREAQKLNICITIDEYIPYDSKSTSDRIVQVVQKLKKQEKALAVVLFCFVRNLGDKILEEAEKQGVKKVWLTSEAWNPAATDIDLKLKNQTEGLLSISLKSHKLDYLIKYMDNEIKQNYECNQWLHDYLKTDFSCNPKPISITADKQMIICGNGTTVNISDLLLRLTNNMPAATYNLIDAVTAVGHGIKNILKKLCNESACNVPSINTSDLTMEMFNISFTNELGNIVSFDLLGNPKMASYTIENLQIDRITGKPVFVPVGSWKQGMPLELNESSIVWPRWWSESSEHYGDSHPSSQCAKDCIPGEYRVGKEKDCCWKCMPCTDNSVSNNKNMEKCIDCGNYSHTIDNITCITTPILWMTTRDPAGMSIVIISAVSLVGMCVVSIILIQLRYLILPNENALHLTTMSCILPTITFVYSFLHIMEPTNILCQTKNAYFFMLLMIYAAILFIHTKYITSYLQTKANNYLKGNFLAAQIILLILLLLLESASIIAWLFVDDVILQEFRPSGVQEIWRQCEVSFTVARIVSIFIPCIILIFATFTAYRERNLEHSFYEPKFLSFTCIALCIIIVAFLPTFKYVVGIYKGIVMAFTIDVFAFTFIACLVLPKVYIVIIRYKRGIGEFPLKPGVIKGNGQNDQKSNDWNSSTEASTDNFHQGENRSSNARISAMPENSER